MVNTINRSKKVVKEEKQKSSTSAPVINSGLTAQIMSGLIQQQNYQVAMQNNMNKNINKILQERNYNPAEILKQQHIQYADQMEQIKNDIKLNLQQQELNVLMPKESVQDSEESNYITPDRLALLEQIYLSLPINKKKFNFAQLAELSQYNTNLKHYDGFVDPNYDKQTRPLGNETNNLTTF